MRQCIGQMSFLDEIIAEPEEKTGKEEFVIPEEIEKRIQTLKKWSFADCEKCDCAFGSIKCFKKRGYIFGPTKHFLRGENGEQLRSNKRECTKELTEEPPMLRKGCWISTRDYGNNRMCATVECDGGGDCTHCRRYIVFYGYIRELENAGMKFGEAVRKAKSDGYDIR